MKRRPKTQRGAESERRAGRELDMAIQKLPGEKKVEDKFLSWFLTQFYGHDPDGVQIVITNGRGDGGIDAIVRIAKGRYSSEPMCVLVQCMYSPTPGRGRRPTPLPQGRYAEFSKLPHAFMKKASLLEQLGKHVDQGCKEQYLDVLGDAIQGRAKLDFLLVTLHSRTATYEKRAISGSGHKLSRLNFQYANDVFALYLRSQHGGTPVASTMSVGYARAGIFKLTALSGNHGKQLDVTVYFAAAILQDLIDATRSVGERLFSENVRLMRNKTDINEGIRETFLDEPDEFFLGHNGISVICTSAEVDEDLRKIRLFNPSIINGSQTLHVLQSVEERRPEARVLLRIICVPVGRPGRQRLVSDIIERSNSQNAVASWELRSSDPVQVKLEHEFAKQRVFYERKAFRWRRGRATLQDRFDANVTMVKMAQILAATSGNADLAGKGAAIFSGDSYNELFVDAASAFGQTFGKYAVFRVVDRAFRNMPKGDGYNPRDALWYFLGLVWKSLSRDGAFGRRSKDIDLMRALAFAEGDELSEVFNRCASLFISVRASFTKRGQRKTWNNAFKRATLAKEIIGAVPDSKVAAVRRSVVRTLEALADP